MIAPRTRMEATTSAASTLGRSAWRKVPILAASFRQCWSEVAWSNLLNKIRLTRSRRAGGLFRKYATLLVALVGGSLIINATIEMYYSYGENRHSLIAVQREKAQGAAAVIEQFVKEIEGQVGWATGFLPAGSGLEQRRFDFLRLLRQAPAITEVSYLDGDGRDKIKGHRPAMKTS